MSGLLLHLLTFFFSNVALPWADSCLHGLWNIQHDMILGFDKMSEYHASKVNLVYVFYLMCLNLAGPFG